MNYSRIYNQIVDNRLKNPYNGYTEKHHIIPRSLGGSNFKDNIVRLNAREHFVCHWLLVKMYRGNNISYYKMLKAFNMMCNAHSVQHERYVVFSRIFARYREDLSKALQISQTGNNNSQSGTMWICNLVTKENKKITKGPVPDGWTAGRNKWKPKWKPKCDPNRVLKEKVSKKYSYGYSVSVNGKLYQSISQAADSIGIGHETARMRFKSKSFPEYIILSR
jgi:hypothetical protein